MWSWQRGFVNRHRIMSVFIQLSIHCLLYHCRVLVMQTSFTEANILWFQKGFNFLALRLFQRDLPVWSIFSLMPVSTLWYTEIRKENCIPILEYVSVFYLVQHTDDQNEENWEGEGSLKIIDETLKKEMLALGEGGVVWGYSVLVQL